MTVEKRVDNYNWKDPVTESQWGGGTDFERPDEFDLLLCLRVLLSYWWVLTPLAVLGAAAGVAYWIHVHPVYNASCRFEVFQNITLNFGGDDPRGRTMETAGLYRHILIMKSAKLNREVRERLAEKWSERIPEDFERYRVSVSPVKDAPNSMLDISIESFDSEYSLDYLNALIEGYQSMRREETAMLNESTLANLRREQSNLAKQLEKAENEIAQFEAEHNIYFVYEKSKSDQALLTALMNRQSHLKTQLAILEAQFPFLKDENAATLRDVLDLTNQLSRFESGVSVGESDNLEMRSSGMNSMQSEGWSEIPEWRKNEAQIIRLQAEYDNMLKTYKDGHPKMLKLEEEIEAAERELNISAQISLKRLQSIKDALEMQQEALLQTAQSFRLSINLTAGERAEYDKLKRRQEHLKKLHDQVYTRIIDSSAASKDSYYSRFVDGPTTAIEPIWPKKWKVVSIGICGMTGVGASIILLSYFVRVRLYDYQSLERSLNLKCLAGVPKFKNTKQGKKRSLTTDVVLNSKNDFASECYRSLRTSIEQNLTENQNVILVTSPDPGEGKTFSVINLAVVFSWNRKKVLIIDGDFRRMTLRKFFKSASRKGLSDCLASNELNWRDVVSASEFEALDYMPAGGMNQHITELLTLPRLQTIMKEIRETYDLVIIDSAPVNRVVDTIILSKCADCVILIARAGKTKVHSLKYCYNRLGMANIIGFILNNIDAASRKYSYYNYSYSYYSAYHQYKTYYKSYPPTKEKQEV